MITNEEYDAACKAGEKEMKRGPIVIFAAYDAASRTLVMTFADGTTLTTPVDTVQGLADVEDADLAEIEIVEMVSACTGRASKPTSGCRRSCTASQARLQPNHELRPAGGAPQLLLWGRRRGHRRWNAARRGYGGRGRAFRPRGRQAAASSTARALVGVFPG